MFSTTATSKRLLMTIVSACLLYLMAGASVSNAAFPGRNGEIAFHRYVSGTNADIYKVNTVTGSLTRLTRNPARDYQPAWSASGSNIAFQSDRDANREIYKMRADGSSQDNLTNTISSDNSPAWSPNGAQIVFSRASSLYTMLSNGLEQTFLFHTGLDIIYKPNWSARGGKIAFEGSNDGELFGIYSINTDGTGLRMITDSSDDSNNIDNRRPDWSPDGTKIVFDKTTLSHSAEIYTMNADGSGVRRLTNNSVFDSNPVWSPDGTKIAFVRNDDIYTMNTDGTGLRRVTTVGASSNPDWQPLR